MSDLVEIFVAEMPAKIATFQRHASAGDWQALGVISHQLKGSAGSYGFHQLTQPAQRVELAARENQPEEAILESVEELLGLCRRLRTGVGPF
jgi:HPt (histidine-containing phosphotransfer) domain-containing protein